MYDIYIVNQNFPTVYLIESHQQIDQGGFPGTSWPDNRNSLPRFSFDVHILNQRDILFIAERDMFELHLTLLRLDNLCVNRVRLLFRLIEEFKDALSRGNG